MDLLEDLNGRILQIDIRLMVEIKLKENKIKENSNIKTEKINESVDYSFYQNAI